MGCGGDNEPSQPPHHEDTAEDTRLLPAIVLTHPKFWWRGSNFVSSGTHVLLRTLFATKFIQSKITYVRIHTTSPSSSTGGFFDRVSCFLKQKEEKPEDPTPRHWRCVSEEGSFDVQRTRKLLISDWASFLHAIAMIVLTYLFVGNDSAKTSIRVFLFQEYQR